MNDFWNTRLILKTYAGSISYGTNTAESDEDFRGVCIPPERYLLGMDNFEQKEIREPDEKDDVIYSLKKFVNLAIKNNPNILDVLFVDTNHITYINHFGRELRDIRYNFLSKQVYRTYGGYAISQLKKMTTVDKNATGKRAKTIERYGYDTKNALHLIRLLRVGIEILEDGELVVFRPDRKELLDIKNGKYKLNEIMDEANRLQELLKIAYDKSKLPSKPNYNEINKWLINIHKMSLEWSGN